MAQRNLESNCGNCPHFNAEALKRWNSPPPIDGCPSGLTQEDIDLFNKSPNIDSKNFVCARHPKFLIEGEPEVKGLLVVSPFCSGQRSPVIRDGIEYQFYTGYPE